MENWVAFSDGACSGNPGPGGWATILWNVEADLVAELGGREVSTTNNRMEMIAARESMRYFLSQASSKSQAKLWLVTDSSYFMKGLEDWLPGWKRNNWLKKDGQGVANQDLWMELDELQSEISELEIVHILGHSGIVENERVDEIAVEFSRGQEKISLFSGSRQDLPRRGLFETRGKPLKDWLKAIQNHSQTRTAKKSSPTKAPGSYYVSVVDGTVETHTVWSACEKRVKGTSGARFKKVKNELEQREFLASLPRKLRKI